MAQCHVSLSVMRGRCRLRTVNALRASGRAAFYPVPTKILNSANLFSDGHELEDRFTEYMVQSPVSQDTPRG